MHVPALLAAAQIALISYCLPITLLFACCCRRKSSRRSRSRSRDRRGGRDDRDYRGGGGGGGRDRDRCVILKRACVHTQVYMHGYV